MSYRTGRYNSYGRWTAQTTSRASGPATDAAWLNSPAVLAAMAKIDRACGGKDRPQ